MALRQKESKFVGWYRKAAAYSIEDLFARKREPGPPRTVVLNEQLPKEYFDRRGRVLPSYVYASNQVITSKYTIITFLPRNLLEQFRRVANIFFLTIAILQFFPIFSTISPVVAILPLIIIVTLTALKDGYEDYGRHQADKTVNSSTVKVLTGGSWSNQNPVKKKSKTFVRGIVNTFKASPRLASKSQARLNEKGLSSHFVDYDYEGAKEGDIHWKRTSWEDLKVGDFVKIEEDEPIPADILLCATSDEENFAYVETKNLDGETNLKSRNAVAALTHLRDAATCADPANSFHVKCDRPEVNMYRLNAVVEVQGKAHSVDLQTTVLRGTVLRNTRWVIGVVLFTGEDSKIVMNSGATPSKRSKVEREMNPQVFFNLFLLAALATVCAIADSVQEKKYYRLEAPWMYGADRSDDNPRVNGAITFVYGILAFQVVVPISLYLTIEVVRTLQAAFIYFDRDIYYAKTDRATLARSWNLSDDLGQIQYIFSDKTGTLTQNLMIFRQCSIGGKEYLGDQAAEEEYTDDVNGKLRSSGSISLSSARKDAPYKFVDSNLMADLDDALAENPNPAHATHARSLNGFFTVLSLCHTVVADKDTETGVIRYKAQSPDEAALVQAAADVGFVFLHREGGVLSVTTPSSEHPERYELLNILEFNSARKRMSVVLRKIDGGDNRIFLLTKGADNVIFERLKAGNDELKATTERHLSDFANSGLRTLTLAYKIISEEDFASWNERYHEATIAMEDREAKIEAVSDELEQDLRLLGATAIEDKLQDGVPEAIADLKRAGIKIWVATGDKLETAIAIGKSTNLISPDSNIIVVRGGGTRSVEEQIAHSFERFFPDAPDGPPPKDDDNTLQRVETRHSTNSIVGDDNGDRPGGFILVIDGAALLDAFDSEEVKHQLLRLSMWCDGVICCRVSPLQKALIVRLVKDGLGVMTLAIGDGANDVSMIQAADVGVGISGEEGLQAVNSSDYAIGQFRFLKKLLLVHGHWSYARNGTMILNFFYKNIVPTGVLWWFQIYCGWSAAFAWEYIYILFWNSVFTVFPVAGIGLFDRFLDAKVLMDVPELYHYGREAYWFSLRQFFIYMFDGIYQSVIIFFIGFYSYVWTTSSRDDGWGVAQSEYSSGLALATVVTVNLFAGLSATAWTWWMVFGIFFGIVVVWIFTAVYNAISPGYAVTALYGNNVFLFESAIFWLVFALVIILAITPRYIAKGYKFAYMPDDIDIMRYIHTKQPHIDLKNDSETHLGIGLAVMNHRHHRRTTSGTSGRGSIRPDSRAESLMTIERPTRPSMDVRAASRTDMSTGMVSVDRGFNFAAEEGGVAMRRMQSNLSERRLASNPNLTRPTRSRFTLRRPGKMSSLLMRKSSTFQGDSGAS